jgi:hypothetical protein
MTLYVVSFRRDAYQSIYVEADNEDEAWEIAQDRRPELDWCIEHDVEYSDHWEADKEEIASYQARTQLRGFNPNGVVYG